MKYFELIFPLLMIAFPGVLTLFLRTKKTAHLEPVRLKERQVWLATAALICVFLLFYCLRIFGGWDPLEGQPFIIYWGAKLDQVMWIGFFPLFHVLAMPLIRLYRPEMDQPMTESAEKSPIRSASLTPRNPSPTLSPRAWIWPIGLWAIGLGVVLVAYQSKGTPGNMSTPVYMVVCGLGLLVSFSIALIVPLSRQTMFLTPEPLDPGHSPELVEAYRKLRRTKARWMFAFILVMTAFTLALPIGLSLHMTLTGANVGLMGAVTGSTIGIAGGAFGTVISLRSMKVQQLLRELSESQTQAS